MIGIGIAAAIGIGGVWWYTRIKPSNSREWAIDQAVLPTITIQNNRVYIKNVRDFRYRSEWEPIPGYYDQFYNLDQLTSASFVFTRFNESRHAAHAFVSFEFTNRTPLAISVEIRKQKNQRYSATKGLFKTYELMYVVADERDVLSLRTHHRGNAVYLYPLELDQKALRQLFLTMLKRAQQLGRQPEFYHTIFNACITNMVRDLNSVVSHPLPFDPRIVISGYADRYFHQHGLLAGPPVFTEAQRVSHITPRAQQCQDTTRLSQSVRTRRLFTVSSE